MISGLGHRHIIPKLSSHAHCLFSLGINYPCEARVSLSLYGSQDHQATLNIRKQKELMVAVQDHSSAVAFWVFQ